MELGEKSLNLKIKVEDKLKNEIAITSQPNPVSIFYAEKAEMFLD